MPDTTCHYSTIRNTSGIPLTVSLIPPHGKALAVNADATVWGDIRSRFLRGGRHSVRDQAAFEAALKNGNLTLLQTPVGFFYDVALSKASTFKINNGAVGVADPCSGAYSGSF